VVHVLRTILAETDLIMAVDGYPTLADLTRDSLRQVRSPRQSAAPSTS
jgi:lactate 2-monooxygenase